MSISPFTQLSAQYSLLMNAFRLLFLPFSSLSSAYFLFNLIIQVFFSGHEEFRIDRGNDNDNIDMATDDSDENDPPEIEKSNKIILG